MLARLSLLSALAAGAAAIAPLTMLTNSSAKCLDGTLSGYYIEPGDPKRFVIYLEGGGECNLESSCSAATTSALGSSKFFSPTMSFEDGAGYASELATNPDFRGWSRVIVPYCSQDLFSGQRTETSPATFGLYLSGHIIFGAVVDALVADHGLAAATDVIFTGSSAGGIGMWINANYLQSRLPTARIVAAPIAGFYSFAFPYDGPNHTATGLVDFREAAWPGIVALWDAYIDPACARGLGARSYACMLSNYSRPYVTLESFVAEAQTDQVQLTSHDWVPQVSSGTVIAERRRFPISGRAAPRKWALTTHARTRTRTRTPTAGVHHRGARAGLPRGLEGQHVDCAHARARLDVDCERSLLPGLPHPHGLLAAEADHWRALLPAGDGQLLLQPHRPRRLQAARRLRHHVR